MSRRLNALETFRKCLIHRYRSRMKVRCQTTGKKSREMSPEKIEDVISKSLGKPSSRDSRDDCNSWQWGRLKSV